MKQLYDNGDVERIGRWPDNLPNTLMSYVPGQDQTPTRFAVDPATGDIYAFVDKKGKFYGNELGSLPKLGDCHRYIIEHGKNVTEKIKELITVSNFHKYPGARHPNNVVPVPGSNTAKYIEFSTPEDAEKAMELIRALKESE